MLFWLGQVGVILFCVCLVVLWNVLEIASPDVAANRRDIPASGLERSVFVFERLDFRVARGIGVVDLAKYIESFLPDLSLANDGPKLLARPLGLTRYWETYAPP